MNKINLKFDENEKGSFSTIQHSNKKETNTSIFQRELFDIEIKYALLRTITLHWSTFRYNKLFRMYKFIHYKKKYLYFIWIKSRTIQIRANILLNCQYGNYNLSSAYY